MKMHKFVFEDFLSPSMPPHQPAAEETAEPEAEPAPSFSEEELLARESASRQSGFQEGFEAGYAKARDEVAFDHKLLTAAVQQLGEQLHALERQLESERSAREATTVRLAMAMARKIVGRVPEESLIEGVKPMLVDALRTLYDVPETKAFIHPSLAEALKAALPDALSQSHYRGTLLVEADANLEPGACRLEWPGGSAIRTPEALWRQLEQLLGQTAPAQTHHNPNTEQES